MKRLYFCLFFVAISVCGFELDAQAVSVRLNNPKIELELAPGESYSGEFEADNTADEELKVRIYLEDWKYKDSGKGDKDFFPAGSTERSASPWISFTPADDLMKSHGHTTVRYTVRIPENTEGGYFSVLFFETILGSTKNEDGSNVIVAGRIGALFLVHVKGSVKRAGNFESISIVPPAGNAPLLVQSRFANTGNVEVMAAGKFLAMDPLGKIAARGDLGAIYTQPGQIVTRESEWVGRLEPNTYQAILTYDLSHGDIRTEERSFTVT